MSDRYRGFYEKESPVYDRRRFETRYGRVFARLHHDALTAFLSTLSPGSHVLDVGCGTGHTSRLLLALGHRVTGLDLNTSMIEQAPDVLGHQGFRFAEGDAFDLPFEGAHFNAATATRFLHLFKFAEQEAVLRELCRVAEPGAPVVVDYDNSSSRLALLPLLTLYNLVRYQRLTPDTNYNSIDSIRLLHESSGLEVDAIKGVAGYHLAGPAIFSEKLAVAIGGRQTGRLGDFLGEQLVVMSHKG